MLKSAKTIKLTSEKNTSERSNSITTSRIRILRRIGHRQRSTISSVDRLSAITTSASLASNRRQILNAAGLLAELAATRDRRVVGRGRVESRVAHVLGTLRRVDDFELESAALRFVLDDRDCFRVAFAHYWHVVHLEYEVLDSQALVLGWRFRLH